jgi:paraquat-inducible protein A
VATETKPTRAKYDAATLERYVICPQCHTLHHKRPLSPGKEARCQRCSTLLYRNDPRYLDHLLAWSLTGLILFVMANLFPLVRIDFLGKEYAVNALSAVYQLVEHGYYLVAVGIFLLVVAVPALMLVDYVVVTLLLRYGMHAKIVRRLLILLTHMRHWSMVDIFLVSILVALIKLSDDVLFHFGVSFWAMVLYVGIDLYLIRRRQTGALWEIYMRRYHHAG